MITSIRLIPRKPATATSAAVPATLATVQRKGPILTTRNKVALSLFNGSGKPMRPMSNLLDVKKRKLENNEATGIIALFKMKPKMWRNAQLWAAVATEILNPGFPTSNNIKSVSRTNSKNIALLAAGVTENLNSAALCTVKMTTTGAEVSIPVMFFRDDTVQLMASVTTKPDVATEFFQQGGTVKGSPADVDSMSLKYGYVTKALKNLFNNLGAKFRIVQSGTSYRMYIDLAVTRTQVEFMCNNDFADVKPLDMYGLVRTWCMGRTDAATGLPRTTMPLRNIVATMPAGGEPRTDADGLLIDSDSSILYLPKDIDNVKRYEVALYQALIDPNTGALGQYDGVQVKKLPVAQSVYLDWINKKWSYVTNEGDLKVRDLSRAQPLTATHIRGIIFTPIGGNPTFENFCTKVSAYSQRVGGTAFANIAGFLSNAVDLINLHEDYQGVRMGELAMYHIAELKMMYLVPDVAWQNRLPELKVYADFCETVHKLIADFKKDEDWYFKDGSVIGMSGLMALFIVFDKWADKSAQIVQADRDLRSKYLSPAVDPNYTVPALPYVSTEGAITKGMTPEQIKKAKGLARGLMPHQANTANQLRNSPDYAILAVQAGGGKTMIIVTDILKEMQEGVKGPFLVMCPSHLVSQYVQEFTYATNGRINVVAVTGYTMKSVGLPGLQKMIESAPINTVVIADYNLAKGASRTMKVGYGTSSTQVFKVVEFLRQFNFQYAAMDESHKLKNPTAMQTRAVAALIADVPKKRLASGTFMDNSPEDVCGQFALLDPTVFGSVDSFRVRYSAAGTTGKIRKMKAGAEVAIMRTLREHSRYVSVKRKEWAAILPPRKEEMYFVKLTDAQRQLYSSILESSVEALKEEAAKNDTLAKLLGIGKYSTMNTDEKEDLMNDLDDEGHSQLEGGLDELLRPYLARLEQFMVAPARDDLGASLRGGDRVSPKIEKLVEIFNKHVYEDEIPGKILVFTNQKASAEALYDDLPANIKKMTIMYTAGRKAECGAEFETDDNKKMMIGVSTSMDTGLNLQFCSRLIRCETVMSPGALEQGNSRVGRPNLKEAEKRPNTYYDWILVENSIDVTKVAYLMTKKVRIAAVEEATNPIFTGMEVPELFGLSLDNITENNSKEALEPYLGHNGMYRNFLMLEQNDYEDFRVRNPHLLDANGKLKMVELKRSQDLAESTIMRRIPYVPGLNIYGDAELGLERLDQYTKVEVKEEVEDEDGTGGDIDDEDDDDLEIEGESEDIEDADDEEIIPTEDAAKNDAIQKKKEFMEKVEGVVVHTDAGEGAIKTVNLRRGYVRIVLHDGTRIKRSILSVFVVTKPQTSSGDVRKAIAKMAGDIPIDTPWDVPAKEKVVVVPSKQVILKQTKRQHIDNTTYINLNLIVTNDMVGLEFDDLHDKKTTKTLEAMGFKLAPKHYFAQIKTWQVMNKFFKTLVDAGYSMPKPQLLLLSNFYYKWKSMGKKADYLFGMATATQQKNFYTITHKPNPSKTTVTPYVSSEGNSVYVCLPVTGFPGNSRVISKVHVPGVRFQPALPVLQRFFTGPSAAAAFVRTLIAPGSGVEISNIAELHAQFTALKREVPKATKKSMDAFFGEKETK